jgi:hypothetical protein
MASYPQIREYVRKEFGVRGVKDCHIAHAKEMCGIPVRRSWRRKGQRMIPCPSTKFPYLEKAFRHFGMV